MQKHLTWKPNKGQFSSGSSGYRCGINVFSYGWDRTRPKTDEGDNPWHLISTLPTIKKDLGHFETEEKAQELAEKAFAHFLKRLELTTL